MGRHWILALATSAALAGCATAPPSPLTADSARKLRLDTVSVAVAPDAVLSWANVENEYANQVAGVASKPKPTITETGSLGLQDSTTKEAAMKAELIKSPEGQTFLKEKVAGRLSGALEQTVKTSMRTGDRPVKLDIVVHSFVVPSAVQRVVLGGQPMINASATLRDATTGEVIASRPQMLSMAYAGNGWAGVIADQMFEDLDARLVNNYAQQYRDWLIPQG